MIYAGFNHGNTPGILAFLDIDQFLGKGHLLLLHGFPVLDDADGDVGVDITDHVQVDIVALLVHLDDVLLSHLLAFYLLDDGHAAVQLVQSKVLIDLHALACSDMIKNDAVLYTVDLQSYTS